MSKDFNDIIAAKEKAGALTKSYMSYAATFIFLQLIDTLIKYGSLTLTLFAKLEFLALGSIAAVLFLTWLSLSAYRTLFHRETLYHELLKDYYVDLFLHPYSNYGIAWGKNMTLMAHPEILNYNKDGFWGWGDDGELSLEIKSLPTNFVSPQNTTTDTGYSLVKRPWTFTEMKNVSLQVMPLNATTATETFTGANFKDCMEKRSISYRNKLYIYPLLLDSSGRVIERNLQPIPVTPELFEASDKLILNDVFFRNCLSAIDSGLTFRRGGIISLFQPVDENDAVAKIGLTTLIQVNQSFDTALTQEQVQERLFTSDLNPYVLLMYLYAKGKRYEFVEWFLKKNRRKRKFRFKMNFSFSCLETGITLRPLLYRLQNAVKQNIAGKFLFFAAFALENAIIPMPCA